MERLIERIWTTIWSLLTVNIGTKLVSIGIAMVLWVVVLGSRNVEVTKEIPLEVITPADVVPSNEIPDRIAFRLSGPKAFLRTILDRHEEPIRVNLAGAKPGLVTYRFFSDNIRVPIGVKVLSINPTAILIKLEYIKRREVPVRVSLQGASPDGFRVSKVEVRPQSVKIKGAESVVDSISEVSTLPIDISNFRQSVERDAALDLSRYKIQLDGALPKAFVEVVPLTANFRIKNVDIRVLTPYKARLSEKTVTVLVRADAQTIRSLDRKSVYAVVDMSGKPKGTYVRDVKVVLPESVGLVKVIPDQVKVTLY
ncbi:MAG: CdaR family protein [Oligoflexia bacterium]|nr:CdaR family protein [Oligoflexia bacterium]